jgi:putative ABC transport system substrate-binding protein
MRRVAAFAQALQELGWTDGRNVRFDYRSGLADADFRRYAAELVALAPDVILVTNLTALGPLQQVTRTLPIVFGRRWLRGEPGAAGRQGTAQFAAIQAVATSLRMEVSPVDARDAGEIERAVTEFARGSNGGLIVTSSTLAQVHRQVIIMLAARHRLPAVFEAALRDVNCGRRTTSAFDRFWDHSAACTYAASRKPPDCRRQSAA